MSKIERKLTKWENLGFISKKQVEDIKIYESSQPEKAWVLSGFLYLGFFAIAVGIISVIASNWHQIPDVVKLISMFCVLALSAFWTVKIWEKNELIKFESLLFFFLSLCLASIGLLSQIYHMGGELYHALLLWSVITFAAASTSRLIFIPFLWLTVFIVGLVFSIIDSEIFATLFHHDILAIVMTVPLLSCSLMFITKFLSRESVSTRAFRYWTCIALLVALGTIQEGREIYFEKAIAFRKLVAGDSLSFLLTPYTLGYFLIGAAALGILESINYNKLQKAVLFLILGMFSVPFHLPIMGIKSKFAYVLCAIIILCLMSIFLASRKDRRNFGGVLVLLGLEFLILYFEAFGGLARTGLGLIIEGFIIIGMVILWNKYRTKLHLLLERWIQ